MGAGLRNGGVGGPTWTRSSDTGSLEHRSGVVRFLLYWVCGGPHAGSQIKLQSSPGPRVQ